MTNCAFWVVTALFSLKILWNFLVPYVLAMRKLRSHGAMLPGISLMPLVELFLLALAICLSWSGALVWPRDPSLVALVGGAMCIGSYLHLVVAGTAAGWIGAKILSRRGHAPRNRQSRE